MPDGITAGEILTHERLIDEDQCSAACYLALVPNTAADEGNSQGGEVLRADEFHVSLLRLGRRLSENLNGKGPAAVGRSGVAGDCGGKDPRSAGNLVPKFGDEAGTVRPSGVRV